MYSMPPLKWFVVVMMWSPLPYSVKGPELINKYVGQSEENVREGELAHILRNGVEFLY